MYIKRKHAISHQDQDLRPNIELDSSGLVEWQRTTSLPPRDLVQSSKKVRKKSTMLHHVLYHMEI